MYDAKVREDRIKGNGAIHDVPHAKELYHMGVHDTLIALKEWQRLGLSPETLSELMEELYRQTE